MKAKPREALAGLWQLTGLPVRALGFAHVQVALAQTGQWLRGLGRLPDGLRAVKPDIEPYLEAVESGFGSLRALRHSAQLVRTPAYWARRSMPPGTDLPSWAFTCRPALTR